MEDEQNLDLCRKEENFLWGRGAQHEQLTERGDDYLSRVVKVERWIQQNSISSPIVKVTYVHCKKSLERRKYEEKN